MTGSTESGKISLVLYVDVEHGVLIETLWNVKEGNNELLRLPIQY